MTTTTQETRATRASTTSRSRNADHDGAAGLDVDDEQVEHARQEQRHLIARDGVGRPKGSVRSVAIPAFVAKTLDEHLTFQGSLSADDLVFQAPAGGYLRPENFRRRVWAPAVRSAGLEPLRLHDLRHTCASLAIAAGADVKVLQRMLGHASAALTLDRSSQVERKGFVPM